MSCSEFISKYTEYRDGLLPGHEAERLERHEARCEACGSYGRVLEEGVVLLRSLPPVPVPEDFRPRLQHRIFHLEDDDRLGPGPRSSGITTMAAAGLSLLLAVAAWSPVIRTADAPVELPPVVVTGPSPTSSSNSTAATYSAASSAAPRPDVPRMAPSAWPGAVSLWEADELRPAARESLVDRSTTLLLRYSPLYSGRGAVRFSRSALD